VDVCVGGIVAEDRAQELRRFAAECLTLARQASDLNIRASLLDMAQKWLELSCELHGAQTFSNVIDGFNEQQLRDDRQRH
jgi:hypothetical protein